MLISLTNVTIGNSVTNIGDFAFGDCASLTSVTIPGSVVSIGEGAFAGCSSLTNIAVNAGNASYASLAEFCSIRRNDVARIPRRYWRKLHHSQQRHQHRGLCV